MQIRDAGNLAYIKIFQQVPNGWRVRSHLFEALKDPALVPRKFDWKKWPAHGAAFALAITVAFVRELHTSPLRILVQATGQPPRTKRSAFTPAMTRGPDRFRALQAGKRQVRAVSVVTPRQHLFFGGQSKTRRRQNTDKKQPKKNLLHYRHDTAACITSPITFRPGVGTSGRAARVAVVTGGVRERREGY